MIGRRNSATHCGLCNGELHVWRAGVRYCPTCDQLHRMTTSAPPGVDGTRQEGNTA